MDHYKEAWLNLIEIMSILKSADCASLSPADVLRLMQVILVSERADKPG